MTENILEKLFEHNLWANAQIIQACSALNDQQLDAEPQSATKGNIRSTLFHLVTSQKGYLRLLTLPVKERLEHPEPAPTFAELLKSASSSGEGLLAKARDRSSMTMGQLQTTDGFVVEPWVVMVQVINHATEHREQIKSMLSALRITPPNIDGWDYAEFTNAMIPIEKEEKG